MEFMENLLENELKQSYLSDLMPYDLNKKVKSELRISLKEYKMLLDLSIEAINALDRLEIDKFDALVGENACQIRAVWIAIIAKKNLVFAKDVKNKIKSIKTKATFLLKENIIGRLMKKEISLEELLVVEELFVPLNLQELFTIQCFLLREVRLNSFNSKWLVSLFIKEKGDPKKLKKFGDISSSFADKLVSKVRKNIAKISVQFVRESANKSGNTNLIKMLSDEFTINHNNHLQCTPMFWAYKALLFEAKNEEIPLILHTMFIDKNINGYEVVDETWFLFASFSDKQNFVLQKIEEADFNKPAFVVQGIALYKNAFAHKEEWMRRMLKHSINTIILAGAADHKQYPDQKKDNLIHHLQDREYETFKSFAKLEGFSSENPTTFFIQHVFPIRMGTFMHKIVASEKLFSGSFFE